MDVYFDARQTALVNNGEGIFIAAKYNGEKVDWDPWLFKIKVVEGEGRFEFYDTRTGETVAEKVVDVKPGMTDTFAIFQPLMEAPVTFIDPKADAREPAAPDGHFKIKVANYAQMLIPFQKVHLNIYIQYYNENWEEQIAKIGAVENIANNMNDATFQTIPDGVPEGVTDYAYFMEVVNGDTGEALKNYGGTNYSAALFSPTWLDPQPAKNVYTFYLGPYKAWGETPFFLKHREDFYEIMGNMMSYY